MSVLETKRTVVVDASNQRLGRMASRIAKMLLLGMNVIVVNAEKAVITGKKKAILELSLIHISEPTRPY